MAEKKNYAASVDALIAKTVAIFRVIDQNSVTDEEEVLFEDFLHLFKEVTGKITPYAHSKSFCNWMGSKCKDNILVTGRHIVPLIKMGIQLNFINCEAIEIQNKSSKRIQANMTTNVLPLAWQLIRVLNWRHLRWNEWKENANIECVEYA